MTITAPTKLPSIDPANQATQALLDEHIPGWRDQFLNEDGSRKMWLTVGGFEDQTPFVLLPADAGQQPPRVLLCPVTADWGKYNDQRAAFGGESAAPADKPTTQDAPAPVATTETTGAIVTDIPDHGAKGDGATDDTAALQTPQAGSSSTGTNVTPLPAGHIAVTEEVKGHGDRLHAAANAVERELSVAGHAAWAELRKLIAEIRNAL